MRALTPLVLLSLLAAPAAAQDPGGAGGDGEDIFRDSGPPTEGEAPPDPAPAPAAPTTTGELFINVDAEGVPVYIDGERAAVDAPAVIKGVATGRRTIELRTDCTHYQTDVDVKADRIVRVQAKMSDGTGALEITTTPPGAEIFIDGEARGPGPQTLWGLSCAEHTVKATAIEHHPFETTLMVPAFVTTPLKIDLDPFASGVLVVSVAPLNARVVVDGVVVAEGPVTLEDLPTGPHEVAVVLDGYPGVTHEVEIKADIITRIEIDLTAPAVAAPPQAAEEAAEEEEDEAGDDEPPPSAGGGGLTWGRVVLNSGVTLAGLGAGVYALNQWLVAQADYDVYMAEPDDDIAAQIWAEEVSPKEQRAMFAGIASGLLLAGGAALWITTDFTLAPAPMGLTLTRSW